MKKLDSENNSTWSASIVSKLEMKIEKNSSKSLWERNSPSRTNGSSYYPAKFRHGWNHLHLNTRYKSNILGPKAYLKIKSKHSNFLAVFQRSHENNSTKLLR